MAVFHSGDSDPYDAVARLISSARARGNRREEGRLLALHAGQLGRDGRDYRPTLNAAANAILSGFTQFTAADWAEAAVALAGAPNRATELLAALSTSYKAPDSARCGARRAAQMRLVYGAACLLANRESMIVGGSTGALGAIRNGCPAPAIQAAISRDLRRVARLKRRGLEDFQQHLPVTALLLAACARQKGISVRELSWR